LHKGGDIVREQFRCVGAAGLAAAARTAKVHREAREMLRVVLHLEGVALLVGGEVGDEDNGLTFPLDLVVNVDAVRMHSWHVIPP
jgi:hypothetical protein